MMGSSTTFLDIFEGGCHLEFSFVVHSIQTNFSFPSSPLFSHTDFESNEPDSTVHLALDACRPAVCEDANYEVVRTGSGATLDACGPAVCEDAKCEIMKTGSGAALDACASAVCEDAN